MKVYITKNVKVSPINKVLNGKDLVKGTEMDFDDAVAERLIASGIASPIEETKGDYETKDVVDGAPSAPKPAPKKRKTRKKSTTKKD